MCYTNFIIPAQKYKLYKKLSKSATIPSDTTLQPKGLPVTPPRQTFSTSDLTSNPTSKLLLSASRFVETTIPLASYNPFSPQKKDKGKQRESIPSTSSKLTSHPFASPQKSFWTLETKPSPGPSQPTQTSISSCLSQELPSAISRARKRLRGEPVSPSPNKEKRRRVLSPAIPPLPKLQLQALVYDTDSNESDGKEDNDPDGGDSSFVDDSPMKPAANGKAFTTLFQETIKPTFISELCGSSAPAVKARADVKLPRTKLPEMDVDIFNDDSRSIKKPSFKPVPSVKSNASALTKSRSKLIQSTLPLADNNVRKRSLGLIRASDESMLSSINHGNGMVTDDAKESPPFVKLPTSTPQLLPPSPNPNTSRLPGKSKSSGSRTIQPSKSNNHKKLKLQDHDTVEDTDNDGEGSPDDLNMRHTVNVVHHSRGIRTVLAEEENDFEIKDPILNYVQPRSQGSASLVKQGNNDDTYVIVDEDEDTNVSVDDEELGLPSRLHRNLVLESLKSKQTQYEEEKIVKRLLSGRRVLHYDPKKGGEIWGVGEDERDEFAGDEGRVDESDEWEGDPVPWEVGELSETHYHLEELG